MRAQSRQFSGFPNEISANDVTACGEGAKPCVSNECGTSFSRCPYYKSRYPYPSPIKKPVPSLRRVPLPNKKAGTLTSFGYRQGRLGKFLLRGWQALGHIEYDSLANAVNCLGFAIHYPWFVHVAKDCAQSRSIEDVWRARINNARLRNPA